MSISQSERAVSAQDDLTGRITDDLVSRAARAVQESKTLVTTLRPTVVGKAPSLFSRPMCGSCGRVVLSVISVCDFDEDETRDEVGVRLASRIISNVVTCAACYRSSPARREKT